jgi:hypothetical protein
VSAYRIIEIVCDLCGAGEGEDASNTTIAELRRRLRDEERWVRSDGEDICGTCRTQQARDAAAALDRLLHPSPGETS